jgi:hypothetical protein
VADETARTALIFDASGAQKGAADFAAAGAKVIATEAAVAAAAEKSAATVDQSEVKKAASRSAGSKAATDAADVVVTQLDRIVKSTTAQTAVLDRYARQWDPLAAKVQTAARQLATLNDIASKTSGDVQARALNMAAQATDRLVIAQKAQAAGNKTVEESAGQARFATQQLSVQTVQFFSSLQAGTPLLTAFIQQGHQIVDVSLATGTGLGTVAKGIGDMFASVARWVAANPLTVGVGLITAAIAGIAVAAESASRRFIDLQQQLRAVSADYAALATTIDRASKAAGASTTLSTSQARSVQQLIVSQAPYAPTDQASLVQLTKLAADLARTFNEDLTAAATRLAVALQTPAKAAQDLADRQFPGMTQALARHIDMLVKQGNIVEAQTIIIDAYTKAVGNSSEEGTALQKTMIELNKQFDALTTNLGKFGNDAVGWIARLREYLKGLGIVPPDNFNYNARPPMQTGQELIDSQTAALQRAFPSLFASGGTVLSGPPIPGRTETAQGVMQMLPSTAAARGLPTGFIEANAGQNIIAGLGLLNSLNQQPGADVRSITKAYGGFSDTNTAGLEKRLSAQAAANVGSLPSDIQGGIKFVAGLFGWPDWLTQLALQTAVLESGGNQFKQTGAASNVKTGTEQYGPGAADAILQGRWNDATKQFAGTTAGQREALQATIDGLKQLRDQLGANSDAGKQITTVLGPLEGQLVNLRTATEQYAKGLRDQTAVSGIEEGAAKRLADAYQQLDEASIKETGHAASAAEKDAARAVILQGLGKDMQLVIATAGRQIAANQELAAATEQGNTAVVMHTASIKAETEALAFGERGTQAYAQAKELLTQKNVDVARSEGAVAASQQSRQNLDTIEYIQRETDTLGLNNDARTLNLAKLKAEQDANRLLSESSDEVRQKYVAQQVQIASMNLALQNHTKALDTVAGMFETSFDTIGNAITQALVQGQGAAVNFRNVLTSVAQQILQQFLKLAVLNPLLNSLFGGKRDTLGGIFDALDNVTPGSTKTESSGGGGILGTVISLVGKVAGLFGGGAATGPGNFPDLGAIEASSQSFAASLPAASPMSLPGLYHAGGIVGDNDNVRLMPAAMFANAPRYHGGLGGNEFAAILQKGERVLTERQQQQVQAVAGGGGDAPVVHVNIDARGATTEAVGGFRRSLPQMAVLMADQMARAKGRTR